MSFFNTSPPHGGGDQALFEHFSSLRSSQRSAGRFGGRKFPRKQQYFLLDGRKCSPKAVNFLPERILMVGNGLESERSSYCKVGRVLKNMLPSYQLASSKRSCGRN